MPLGVFKRVPSRCADPTTQLWSGPFSPPLSSSQKKYVKLLTNHFLSLKVKLSPLPDVIRLLPYFIHCIKYLQR